MKRVLVVDDEQEIGNFFQHLLAEKEIDVQVGLNGDDFNELIATYSFDIALLDLKLPDCDGIHLCKQLKKKQPLCKVIIMTGYSTVKTAVDALKNGAIDYIEKPFDNLSQLETLLDKYLSLPDSDNNTAIDQIAKKVGFIIGTNKKMQELVKIAEKIAKKHINVLIEGETGTGKEVLASFIHHLSSRYNQPFYRINCGAISETLLESELFGHEKGAFTGAFREKKGIFEIANNGTLFLDEIGEASLSIQVQLLRVLESGEYYRVGGEKVRKTNTRIIAATNKNLELAVKEKTFREDLLYRLDVVKFEIPPLRSRIEDLPLFLSYFLKKLDAIHLHFANETIKILQNYDWPGNIRELFNVVKRALALIDDDTTAITPEFLPGKITNSIDHHDQYLKQDEDFEHFVTEWTKELLTLWNKDEDVALNDVLEMIKQLEQNVGKSFVMKSLKKYAGDRKKTAESLNITPRQLKYLLNEKGKI